MKFVIYKHNGDIVSLREDDLISFCMQVDKQTIHNAAKNGATSLEAIKKATKSCTDNECKTKNPTGKYCSQQINELIKLYKDSR